MGQQLSRIFDRGSQRNAAAPPPPSSLQALVEASGLYFGPYFVTSPPAQANAPNNPLDALASGLASLTTENAPNRNPLAGTGVVNQADMLWAEIWGALNTRSDGSASASAPPAQGLAEPQAQAPGPPQPMQTMDDLMARLGNVYRNPANIHQITTLQSKVHIKKSTIRLVRVDPEGYFNLEFSFDAAVAVKATIHWMAEEVIAMKVPGQRSITFKPLADRGKDVLTTYSYPAKLAQTFQQPGERFYPKNYSKDLWYSGSDEPELNMPAATPEDPQKLAEVPQLPSIPPAAEDSKKAAKVETPINFFPLVIVLEAVESTYGVQAAGMNSEITYATLIEKSDAFEVKVMKQKALIDGVYYILQDIYGFTEGGKDELTKEDLQSQRECVICMSEPKDTTVLPCRHLCLCHECADVLRLQGRGTTAEARRQGAPRCPICRQVFHSLLQVTLPKPFASEATRRDAASIKSRHSLIMATVSRLNLETDAAAMGARDASQISLSQQPYDLERGLPLGSGDSATEAPSTVMRQGSNIGSSNHSESARMARARVYSAGAASSATGAGAPGGGSPF
ncbi:uncharacterized protein BJ171DRAFT_254548 [Polychytrium aggregatum]|uniref:uncharacterized protein n=1 Tax=Polychytrium aggregatum TaxID=110093 RepID=UPI0022FE954C|nr:uncharacterized protein BJ171DRAFT_254548 [Polychytrium aggregatum]KAI9207741.1 hypothetical protein BJ171DRAFT_254548 [Polychytrium aggregatum]